MSSLVENDFEDLSFSLVDSIWCVATIFVFHFRKDYFFHQHV